MYSFLCVLIRKLNHDTHHNGFRRIGQFTYVHFIFLFTRHFATINGLFFFQTEKKCVTLLSLWVIHQSEIRVRATFKIVICWKWLIFQARGMRVQSNSQIFYRINLWEKKTKKCSQLRYSPNWILNELQQIFEWCHAQANQKKKQKRMERNRGQYLKK